MSALAVTLYKGWTKMALWGIVRTSFLSVRLESTVVGAGQSARPPPPAWFGAVLDARIQHTSARPNILGRARKKPPMSIDLDKYRAAAKAAGDLTHYSDADILRLWAVVGYLAERSMQQVCPHLSEPHASYTTPKKPPNPLHSEFNKPQKEASP